MIYQYNKSDGITLQNVTVIQRTYQNSEVTTESVALKHIEPSVQKLVFVLT